MLGMYVHTHWGYNRPYSARRWTLDDWEGYLDGLAKLGYDLLMVWPQLDTMPAEPTRSDVGYLQTLSKAIDLAHGRHGMKTVLVLAGNCIGNEKAADYDFHSRPYFVCEKKVNPKDSAELKHFMDGRKRQLSFLRNADAVAVIDSDPGGFPGSSNEDFANLCRIQADAFRAVNPGGEFVYWMLLGWEGYCKFWTAQRDNPDAVPNLWEYQGDEDYGITLGLLKQRMPEPWSLMCWLPAHEEAVDTLGLRDKALYFPYGVIEGEPVFPLTVCNTHIAETVTYEALRSHPLGVMGNAQTHCLQLPNTYWFAKIARGESVDPADLAEFAGRLLPGLGEIITAGWNAVESRDPHLQARTAEALKKEVGKPHAAGDLSGLLFGDPDRFLVDLAMNLELRAAMAGFEAAARADRNMRQSLQTMLGILAAYQRRVGFEDAYGGPLDEGFNKTLALLHDPRIDAVLRDFDDWRNPAVRNGIVPRLLDAVASYLKQNEQI